jgi:hypothetical protein
VRRAGVKDKMVVDDRGVLAKEAKVDLLERIFLQSVF